MKQILCFGDSNTFGYIPGTGKRYEWGTRWTSILNEKLGLNNYRIVEEGLVGRTTIFDDPIRFGRKGTALLPTLLESHQGMDLVIVMLGTNDCKVVNGLSSKLIAKGVATLIQQIKEGSPESKILIVSPIHLGNNVERYDFEFSSESVKVSKELASEYEQLTIKENVYFFDAATVAEPSETDQEHMNEEGHNALGNALYKKVMEIEGGSVARLHVV